MTTYPLTRSDRLYHIQRAAYELASLCEAAREARMDTDEDEELTQAEVDALMELASRVSGGTVALVGQVLNP